MKRKSINQKRKLPPLAVWAVSVFVTMASVQAKDIQVAYGATIQPAFTVFQYVTPLKTFNNYDDAVNYAKLWDHSRVVYGSNSVWDNYPDGQQDYKVYQYSTFLQNFNDLTNAINYAKLWDHSRVINGKTNASEWDNYPRITQYPQEPNFYEVRNGSLYHVLGSPDQRSGSFYVGPAPSFLQSGAIYVRDMNHKFYRRGAWGDVFVGTYVPLYDSLDLRLPAPIQASDIDRFIQSNSPNSPLIGLGQTFIDAQNQYGVNAQYLVAHAVHESAWGTSEIAKDKNNLFGYMAYDSNPYGFASYFASLRDAINYQAYFVATQYLSPQGQWYEGSNLAGMNVHYATDPLWAEKILGYMKRLHPFNANEYTGKQVLSVSAPKPQGPVLRTIDETLAVTYPSGALGVITGDYVNFRAKPSTSSEIYQSLSSGTQLTVIGKGTGNWYKVTVGGQIGWVSTDFVKLLNVLQVVNVSDSLNIRSGPYTSFSIVSGVKNGTYLTATLSRITKQPITTKGWFVIKRDGQDRYVNGEYIQQVQ